MSLATTARQKALEENAEIRQVCDQYLSKSQRLYFIFYMSLATSTLFAGVAQLLVYEEKHYESIASRLDLAAMSLSALSTIILQILAISGIKSIASSLNRVGRLLNVYLSPFVNSKEKKEIVAKVLELTLEIEPFWVSLPRFNDGKQLAEILGAEEHTKIQAVLSRKGGVPYHGPAAL